MPSSSAVDEMELDAGQDSDAAQAMFNVHIPSTIEGPNGLRRVGINPTSEDHDGVCGVCSERYGGAES